MLIIIFVIALTLSAKNDASTAAAAAPARCRRNPHRDNPSHIVPFIVGDPVVCQEIAIGFSGNSASTCSR
jgi:hypothetical protein